jgi:4-amino-4-deoxy-L-arabinose transferase-like glycosyltransferase
LEKWWKSGTAIVVWIAVGTVVVHLVTGWRYGFDRDELMALEDARHLAWGFVQYPPMTAFFGWVALQLFGTSLVGFRFFAAVAQAVAVVLTGLMAKEIWNARGSGEEGQDNAETQSAPSGCREAQVMAALAAVPFCLGGGALMQYISFDYLCWVWVAYCVTRVAAAATIDESEKSLAGERWWLGVGMGMGLGMLAKYTMGFFVCGVVVGICSTELWRYLQSKWLWIGAAVAWLIFLPNLLWQWRRHFISLEFLKFLHARDVGEGLTDWFLTGQAELTLLALPLALVGLAYCFGWIGKQEGGGRFRILGWMYVVPLSMFLVMQGRDYYLAPAYPMLYAAGAVWAVKKLRAVSVSSRAAVARVIWACLVLDVAVAGAVALPIAPVGSRWWKFAARVDSVLPEEIGWPEFVQAVAGVRDRLAAEERVRVGILAGNYGEVGALNLYGEKYNLPWAMSGVNSSWERGYGDPPEVLIVVGYSREFLEGEFASCVVGGKVWNSYGVMNEETIEDPEIFVCRGMKRGWPEFWARARRFA